MIDTKTRILDAAEQMVAEHGLDVSLRTITAEAGVNLAAVNYHFQSKDALIDAVVARRIEPINAARLRLLEALEIQHPQGDLPLEGVLRAFVAPAFELASGEHTMQLVGRMFATPDVFLKRVFEKHLASIAQRFSAAFRRALPELTREQTAWNMLFTVGAMLQVMGWSRLLPLLSHGAAQAGDPQAMTDHLVAFAAAGFQGAVHNEANIEKVKHA
jgi:AcrR family transcriptional regulator